MLLPRTTYDHILLNPSRPEHTDLYKLSNEGYSSETKLSSWPSNTIPAVSQRLHYGSSAKEHLAIYVNNVSNALTLGAYEVTIGSTQNHKGNAHIFAFWPLQQNLTCETCSQTLSSNIGAVRFFFLFLNNNRFHTISFISIFIYECLCIYVYTFLFQIFGCCRISCGIHFL